MVRVAGLRLSATDVSLHFSGTRPQTEGLRGDSSGTGFPSETLNEMPGKAMELLSSYSDPTDGKLNSVAPCFIHVVRIIKGTCHHQEKLGKLKDLRDEAGRGGSFTYTPDALELHGSFSVLRHRSQHTAQAS